MLRVIGICAFFSILSACNTTQDVTVDTTTTVTGNAVNTNTKVRVRQISQSSSETQVKAAKTTSKSPISASKLTSTVAKQVPVNKSIDKTDLAAVSGYCEKFAYEALFIKEKCTSSSERKICKSAQFGNATFIKEFNHCLKQYGWETY